LRNFALSKLDLKKAAIVEATEASVESIAQKDPSRITRSRAVEILGNLKKPAYKTLFTTLLNDSSYTLSAAALTALEKVDAAAALVEAKRLSKQPMKGNLVEAVATTLIKSGDESSFDEIIEAYSKMGLTQAKFTLTSSLANFVGIIKNTEKVKRGVDEIVKFRNAIPEQYGVTPVIDGFLKTAIGKKETAKKGGEDVAALQEQIDYIKSKLKN
jgi:aminopeptidase N